MMLMTQMQSIRITGFLNTLIPGKNYYSHMVTDLFDDGHPPPMNSLGEFINYTILPDTWAVDAMEVLLGVADKLDYINILNT